MKFSYILFLVFFSISLKAQTYADITASEAYDLIAENNNNAAFTILDVRTPAEYLPAHIEGAFNRNYYDTDFEQQMDSLNKERIYLIYCQSGGRSGQTLLLMESLGFETVYNMLGGMNAWNVASYPTTDIIPEFVDLTAPLNPPTNQYEIENESIKIYPNPASNYVGFSSTNIVRLAKVFDINGKLVREVKPLEATTLSLEGLPSGKYLVSFYNGSNTLIQVNQFVKVDY